jgi:hypothetical protein
MEIKIFLDEELPMTEANRINSLIEEVKVLLPEIVNNAKLLTSLKIDIANGK